MKNDTGKYLRRVRADLSKKAGHKLTSLDLAASLGIPRTTYSRYERGGNITIELLIKLYEKYNVMPLFVCIGKLPMYESGYEKQSLVTDISAMKADILALKAMVRMLSQR